MSEIGKFEIPDRHLSWLLRGQITDSYLRHERPTHKVCAEREAARSGKREVRRG